MEFFRVTHYNKEELRQKIREYRAKFYSHSQIMEMLQLKPSTYWYHWNIIKTENNQQYDKYTAENVRTELDRTIAGLEQSIQQLEAIIADTKADSRAKTDAIKAKAELIVAIPRVMRDGVEVVAELGIRPEEASIQSQETTEASTG